MIYPAIYIMAPRSLHPLTISLIFLLIPLSTQLRSLADHGGKLVKPATQSQVEIEKTMLRGQIGSRPPRCERKCGSCGHCEAIQVPTTPQIKKKNPRLDAFTTRGDYSSNYKPLSWKCKCGSFIFNP